MKTTLTLQRWLFTSAFVFLSLSVIAQTPGGVSTGTVRGWKAEYFDGNHGTNFNAFGLGSGNTNPGLWGYTGYVSGEEFIARDADYFGLQYSGTLEVPQAGNYSFNLYNIDDHAQLYIDGVLRIASTWSGSPGNKTATVNLTAGDHTVLIKFIEAGSVNSVFARWSGPGITSNSELDGRFVRVDNAALAAWYKGADVNVTPNYSTGRSRLNSFINKAPAFNGNGNISNLGSGWAPLDTNSVNFNASGQFDGDDWFANAANQNGLSLRTAPRSAFMVNSFSTNTAGASFLWGQNGNTTGTNAVGMYKNSGTQTSMARQNDGNPMAVSAYYTNEPKLLTGDILLGTGNAASVNNSRSMSANGAAATVLGFTERITNYAGPYGIQLGAFLSDFTSGANIPEFIYYPFELTTQQKQRVNTYLAIKYGITLQHNYLNTSGTILWNRTTNSAYNNRIFGIGREMAAEGLNQKQSQSQMTGATGNNFLVLSKGAVTGTNASNTGVLSDGDYMIIGDDNGALAAQTTEIPASFTTAAGCTAARITREWKVQTSGNPGAVTLRAGAAGAYLFPSGAAGLSVLVDTDGDGNFTSGTVNSYPATINNAGVATFSNVTISNGAVITFAWSVTAPGGVSSSLALWLKADGELYSDVAGTTPITDGATVALWRDASALGNSVSQATAGNRPTYRNNATQFVNYNPVLQFTMGSSYLQTSSVSSALNNNITGFTAHRFAGNTSNWNAVMGSRSLTPRAGWNLYITNTTAEHTLWTGNVAGWANVIGLVANSLPELLSFSALTGTGAKFLYEKGRQTGTGTGEYLVNTTRQFQVGSNGDNDLNFGGNIYEQIIFSSVLSDADRRKVESYLAVKYGTPLDQTTAQNYTASDGTVIWNGTTNILYKNNVFGIGRDDCSGLMQKQSKSSASGDIVAIALNALATSNQANTGTFTNNKQYLLVGNDAAALTPIATDIPAGYTAISCNARRYAREWKVQNSNSTGAVSITIGDAANKIKTGMTNLRLAVDTDGDGNFATGTATLYTFNNLKAGVATFNNVSLPNGAVFTLCWTEAAPGGVLVPTSGTTSISGVPHLNGLTYKFYIGTAGNYTMPLDLNAVPVMPGTLVSSGYLSSLSNIQTIISQYSQTTYLGMEISGKIYIPASSATYRFQSDVDDHVCVRINGNNILNITNNTTQNSADVSLAAGYHDILIRFGQSAGGTRWNLFWNNGSGGTYSAIPEARLFTTFSGPSAWYAADDIQLQNNADGTNLGALAGTKWADISANANDLIQASGNPLYYNSNSTYLRNYNPSVYFTADYFHTSSGNTNGIALGETPKSVFSVAQGSANGINDVYTSLGYYGAGNNTRIFGTLKRNTNALSVFTLANDFTESAPFYTSATVSTDIVAGVIAPGRVASVYANGATRGSGTLATYSTWLPPGGAFHVGTYYGFTGTAYTGNMNEIIHYPWSLSATEQQKINSYLAVKWGITLDQTTPTNYLAADGTVTWAGDAVFKYDITGIGRDDCSALNQLQSTSTDGNDMVTIGKSNIATTNYSNDSSFSADKQFVIFSHDNGFIDAINTTSRPTALAAISSCYQKLGRIWKSQATGTVGSVQLRLGKQGLFVFNKSYYKPKLIISSSPTDFTSATIVDADSVSNGIVQFSNVSFTGTQYFTVAIIQAAPGAITGSLNLWLAADDGTSTKTDNAAITSWSDLSLMNMHGTGVNGPLYRSGSSVGAINFNPSVSFNGTSQRFTLPSGFANFLAGTSMFSVINAGAAGDWGRVLQLGTSAVDNFNGVVFTRMSTGNNAGIEIFPGTNSALGTLYTAGSNPLATGVSNIIDWNIAAGSSGQTGRAGSIRLNGATLVTTSSLATPVNIARTVNTLGSKSAVNFFAGAIPELILYNRDLTATERQRVHSYLSVKYGRTLDVSIGNYTNSAGISIYGYTTHWNRITAIGRDDCQALEQKQSKSAETGGLVTIGIGSSIATSVDANTNTFGADKSYAVLGDNGKAVSWTGVDNFGKALVRLNRIWRMKETGTIGTVYIEVPGNSSALATKLPASNAPADPVYLVVSNSGNFKGAVTMIEMTPDVVGAATKWYITHDFADGDYFTFATKKLCLGPAGITDGLTTWYRADNKTNGAIAPTSGTIIDETGTHTLTRNGFGTANVIAGSGTSFNYNKAIHSIGGAAFVKGSLNETAVISPNTGAMYGVATSAANLFMISNNTTNKTGINAAPVFMGGTGGAFTSTTLPNIYLMNYNGATVSGSNNGTAVTGTAVATSLPAAANYSLGLGAYVADGNFNYGHFAEAFSLNRSITTAEQQVLNSYLAIKYGQTISHNYYTADYDGTNAATSTIYDISTYNNRVFGLGIDSTGCLAQKQSTSQLPGSMLKMSIGTAIAAENTANTSTFALDRTYVAAGDDNGAINAWNTGTIPAIYNTGTGSCNQPTRITRQWKLKAINNQQSVLITIPASSSGASTKLPVLPVGATKLFMVVNQNVDFSINASQEELQMTFNATSNEWEVTYTLPDGVYKYITFVTKPDLAGLQPVAVGVGTQDATSTDCNSTPYIYYKGTTNSSNAIVAINPNDNTWAPTAITVNNQGTLTGGGGIFSNSGNGYYQSTDGMNTLRITKRLVTITAPGAYSFNDGVIVRVYYANSDTIPMLTDVLPGTGTIQRKGWFKFDGDAAATVAAMTPVNLPAAEITPVAWGTEQGVKYAEFLVNSFSSFGYFAKTTSTALPVELEYFKGTTSACENVLSWKSSIELNFSHYELQQSSDGIQFALAARYPATGEGSVYESRHSSSQATTHYRLKMIDKDGSSRYSKVVTLLNNCASASIILYPNPVSNHLTVQGVKPGARIKVSDAGGRTVASVIATSKEVKIQMTNLVKGVYLVEVVSGQGAERKIFKVVKIE